MTRFSSLTLVVVAAVAVVAVVAQPQPQRGNNAAALGNTDISPLLNDPRMVRLHLNCIKGTGNCNALGRSLKREYTKTQKRKGNSPLFLKCNE